jgi:hypothetical protein
VRYAQVRSGQKLHLVYEAGEGPDPRPNHGQLSRPLCGRRLEGSPVAAGDGAAGRALDGADHYRLTINAPLRHACKSCARVWRARHGRGQP